MTEPSFDERRKAAWKVYEEIQGPALKAYRKIWESAREEYLNIEKPAREAYGRVLDNIDNEEREVKICQTTIAHM